jgi:hypothetical protein
LAGFNALGGHLSNQTSAWDSISDFLTYEPTYPQIALSALATRLTSSSTSVGKIAYA